jgi:hypothetical protein
MNGVRSSPHCHCRRVHASTLVSRARVAMHAWDRMLMVSAASLTLWRTVIGDHGLVTSDGQLYRVWRHTSKAVLCSHARSLFLLSD